LPQISPHRVWKCYALALFLPLLLVLADSVWAQNRPFRRKVLGIYNSDEGKTLVFNPLRAQVEMVLHHLGLELDYHDIATGLPDAEKLAACRGIVVWLDSPGMNNARVYWRWLGRQMRQGVRVALLTGIRPRIDTGTGQQIPLFFINRMLRPMGLSAGSDHTDLPLDIELVHKDSEMVEFERRLEAELIRFAEVRSVSEQTEVFLKLRMRSTGAECDAVVLTPNGGLVMPGYLRYLDADTKKRQWRINPFSFLGQALAVTDTPRPDCTTLNGTRLAYSHIDGDGIGNMSVSERNRMGGEIISEHILEDYPGLPFTVSVIIAEVEKETRGSDRSIELARRIFALPNVEAASHTYSHPLIWSTELVPASHVKEYAYVMSDISLSGRALLSWNIPGYTFSPAKETVLACRDIEQRLLPAGKTCRIVLWSGNCLPDEETVGICDENGLMNMNGGDARFDGEYPSYCYVTPLYRKVGNTYQIHSSNSNENTYTNLWTGPFGGFQNVIQTFVNTESPRRVSPINIYYHFYAGERPAGLHALKVVYDWLVARETFPVYASRYIRIVEGLISTRMEQIGRGMWRISDNGACRTIRFDNCSQYLDLERSDGVIGFLHYQNCLYVHLDESSEHRLALTTETPSRPYLARATADVEGLTWEGNGRFSFRSSALEGAVYVWRNLVADARYAIEVDTGHGSETTPARTDGSGMLKISTVLRGPGRVTVKPNGDEAR